MKVRFRICKWLSREEFLEIVSFADYVGRNGGCSIFELSLTGRLDLDKLLDFLNSLDSFGAVFEDRDRNILEEFKKNINTVIIEAIEPGIVVLRSRRMLADFLHEYRSDGSVWYSRKHKGFVVKPYRLVDVVNRLRSEGFRIEDKTGILEPRERLRIEFVGKLREYQAEALEAWVENSYRGVIALPTGAGKTIVALAAIARLKLPTLIVVYTKEQVREWLEKIRKFLALPLGMVGAYYSDEKRLAAITVTTYQSAYQHIGLLYNRFGLLVVDEAHHLPADKFKLIAEKILAPYRLALSATPYREDGRHEELFRLVGGVIYEKSLQELAERGFVASFQVIPVLVNLEPDEKKKYEKLKNEYKVLSAGRKVEELVKAASAGDERAKKALQLLSQMRLLVALSRAKLAEAKRIVDSELAKGSKILVFTQYIEQAERVGKILGAPVITSKTDKARRALAFELFKRGRYRVLVLTTVGDEGIDVPDANVGLILSGTSSRRQFIQRLGRLLRPQPGKVSKLYYIAVRGTAEQAILKKIAEEVLASMT
ncbi:DEAD/DEAH box helicase [Hyperthermus butylicus]|uniref:DNA or RNA helicases of superfamily II n=1 Tax=Hyperthermus butylicus (strain DSM 5456 / JCM 9403 / PLM1-5) TaxID=415426 RepID=A2BMA0_HYPBU|nr:DEAD/DEAH box helicase [Hyperthermus butylicus]ABM81111.1 DNA or RNA helicases of superfamily II [Hyperthermus butylicus DSM 5456]